MGNIWAIQMATRTADIVTVLDKLVQQLKALNSAPDPAKAAEITKWIADHFDGVKPRLLEHLSTYIALHTRADTDLVTVNVEFESKVIKTIVVQVYYGNTVAQLKEVIEGKTRIPRADQDVRQRGLSVPDERKTGLLMLNPKGEYDVRVYPKPGATWHLTPEQVTGTITISVVSLTGKPESIDIDTKTNGTQLKAMLYTKTGIPVDRMRIVAGTHIIQDYDNILDEWVRAERNPLRMLYS